MFFQQPISYIHIKSPEDMLICYCELYAYIGNGV